jgi:single stranded DNA-binding protein
MDQNFVCVSGKAGKAPEIKEMGANKTRISTFSIAVGIPPREKGGQWGTEWISVKAFQKQADSSAAIGKGDPVMVVGSIKTETWETREGGKASRTYVIAREIICGAKVQRAAPANEPAWPGDTGYEPSQDVQY